MHDLKRHPLRLGREFVAEHLGEQPVHDRVQALLTEAIAVLLGLPDVDVAQSALGPLDREVYEQLVRRGVTEAVLIRR